MRRIPAEGSVKLIVLRSRGQPFLDRSNARVPSANAIHFSKPSRLLTHLATENMSDAHTRIIDNVGEMIRRVPVPFYQDEIVQILVPVGKATRTSETFGLDRRARGRPRSEESRGRGLGTRPGL
jgi:hypothetical protein